MRDWKMGVYFPFIEPFVGAFFAAMLWDIFGAEPRPVLAGRSTPHPLAHVSARPVLVDMSLTRHPCSPGTTLCALPPPHLPCLRRSLYAAGTAKWVAQFPSAPLAGTGQKTGGGVQLTALLRTLSPLFCLAPPPTTRHDRAARLRSPRLCFPPLHSSRQVNAPSACGAHGP